jgi:D-alanine-D-alanine ligase
MAKRRLCIALVYNTYRDDEPDDPDDRGGRADLLYMIRRIAREIRKLGHTVTVLSLADDLFGFQRKLRRINPDVVFNQYDDVINGAVYEMRMAALVRMMGYPLTGSPALALGLCRYKFTTNCLLAGAGLPIPPDTELLPTAGAAEQREWHFPLIVQASQEHAAIGTDRNSVVYNKAQLKRKVREIVRTLNQPALAQRFLRGREFNVSLLGGNRLRVLPLAEVDYSQLPNHIPPIMSYAAKNLEKTIDFQKTSVICPAIVAPELERRIGDLACRAFRAVGGWGYGRLDVRLDENDQPYVLDVNCNPCLDDDLGLVRSAAKAGYDFPQLLQIIIDAALEGQPHDIHIPMFHPIGLSLRQRAKPALAHPA